MEHWDRELEKRVWQRVHGAKAAPGDLAELIVLSKMQAAELRQLDREQHRQELTVLGLLKGLLALSGGTVPPDRPSRTAKNRRELVRTCRERAARMLEICIALETHPRFGPVFTDLARHYRARYAQLEQM